MPQGCARGAELTVRYTPPGSWRTGSWSGGGNVWSVGQSSRPWRYSGGSSQKNLENFAKVQIWTNQNEISATMGDEGDYPFVSPAFFFLLPSFPGGVLTSSPRRGPYAAGRTSPTIRAERSHLSCGNLQCCPAENCSKRIYPYPAGYQLIDSGSPYLKEFLGVTI